MSDELMMGDVAERPAEAERATRATAVELAREKVAELERKLGEIGGRLETNRETRANTSPEDKRTLNDLRAEALKIGLEREDLGAWLGRARDELAEAERAEVTAGDVDLAKQRLLAAHNLREGGKALDEGLSARRLCDWLELADFVHRTRLSVEANGPAPNGQQLRVFTVTAIKTMLAGCPLIAREFEAVAPGQRTTFAKISDDWAAAAERSAREFLDRVGAEFVDAA
jgi:hypothetical protein